MLINDIKRPRSQKKAKARIGRGRKRGYSSGKGTKGQKSRAGHKIRPAVRDLLQRLPRLKAQGVGKNRAWPRSSVIKLSDLESMKETNINPQTLKDAGLIKRVDQPVKILSAGELKRKVSVEKLALSKGAQVAIEKAGGSVTLIEKKISKKEQERAAAKAQEEKKAVPKAQEKKEAPKKKKSSK